MAKQKNHGNAKNVNDNGKLPKKDQESMKHALIAMGFAKGLIEWVME